MKVNAIIIGAGRSGTTSLCEYLKQHPEICFSDIKEVHYFSVEELFNQGEKYLKSYFSTYHSEKIIATADTYLLIDKKAPKRICNYNDKIKIIVLLREPVARAYSSYHYAINNGYQSPKTSFLSNLKFEKEKLSNMDIIQQNNLCHFYGSMYHMHLKEWMSYFPKDNFLILTTEELERNVNQLLSKISVFLQITPFENVIENTHINKAAPVKFKNLQQFLLNRNHPARNLVRPFIKPFKYLVLKSKIIDSLYRFNKKETSYNPLSREEKEIAANQFREDLLMLRKEFDVQF